MKMALTVFAFVGLDVTYTAFDVPMGALAFSMTPNGTERTKLYGIASIGRMIIGAIPAALVAFAAWLPYFNSNLDKAYLVAAVFSAVLLLCLPALHLQTAMKEWSIARKHRHLMNVSTCF